MWRHDLVLSPIFSDALAASALYTCMYYVWYIYICIYIYIHIYIYIFIYIKGDYDKYYTIKIIYDDNPYFLRFK